MASPNLRGLRRDANGDLCFALGGLVSTDTIRRHKVVRRRNHVQVRRPQTTTGEEAGSPAMCADVEDRQDEEKIFGNFEFQAFKAVKKSWTASDWLTLGAVVLGTVAVGALVVASGGTAAWAVVAVIGQAGGTSITLGAVTAGAATTAKIASAAAATSWFASRFALTDEDAEDYEVGPPKGDKWTERHALNDWQNVGPEYQREVSPRRPC